MNSKNKNCGLQYLGLALTLAALPASAETARVYVTNSAGDSVHVIDPATNKVVQVIKGIEAAHGVGFSPDGKRVYVSNEAESTLDVVDQKSGKIVKHVPLSGRPNNIAVTPDGKRVVVAITEPGTLDIIDTAALKLAQDHSDDRPPAQHLCHAGRQVCGVGLGAQEIPERGRSANRENGLGNRVRRRRAADGDREGGRRLDQPHIRATLEPARFRGGRFRRAQGSRAESSSPISPTATARSRAASAPACRPTASASRRTASRLWANSHVANGVFAYSLPDLKPLGFAALPDLKLAGREPIGAIPDWVTFAPDSKTIYVGNSTFNSVSAIDMKTMKVVAQIPVGQVPKRMNTLVMR